MSLIGKKKHGNHDGGGSCDWATKNGSSAIVLEGLLALTLFMSKDVNIFIQPHSPDNRALARECKDVKIDRVYIGSCTGGKTEDFMAAAKVFLASVRSCIYLSFFL